MSLRTSALYMQVHIRFNVDPTFVGVVGAVIFSSLLSRSMQLLSFQTGLNPSEAADESVVTIDVESSLGLRGEAKDDLVRNLLP